LNNEPLISAAGIVKRFGALTAVDEVSLEIYAGEIYGVAGLNGAGKSTLLDVLAGVTRADKGEVLYRGRPSPKGVCIGYVPQETALFPDLSVYDNLKFWALANRRADRVRTRVLAAADATNLTDIIKRPVRALSGGMKQRANIAAALAAEPDILIMDEPTAGLDVKNRRDIINMINTLVKRSRGGLAVICTSHQSGELEMISHRLLLLDRGRTVFDGPPGEVFSGKYSGYGNIDDILYSLSG